MCQFLEGSWATVALRQSLCRPVPTKMIKARRGTEPNRSSRQIPGAYLRISRRSRARAVLTAAHSWPLLGSHWRVQEVSKSRLYHVFCIDVLLNFCLICIVVLNNMYIVFVSGGTAQDILKDIVILDFILGQQDALKKELFSGASGKVRRIDWTVHPVLAVAVLQHDSTSEDRGHWKHCGPDMYYCLMRQYKPEIWTRSVLPHAIQFPGRVIG